MTNTHPEELARLTKIGLEVWKKEANSRVPLAQLIETICRAVLTSRPNIPANWLAQAKLVVKDQPPAGTLFGRIWMASERTAMEDGARLLREIVETQP